MAKNTNLDGWKNVFTGVGDLTRDKRLGADLRDTRIDFETASTLYLVSDMAARIVEALPEEALREGFAVNVDDDREAGEEIDHALAQMHVPAALDRALKWSRAQGGAAIFLGVQDGSDVKNLAEPLDLNRVVSLDSLNVFDARELHALDYYNNPLATNFGEPRLFRLAPRTLGVSLPENTLINVHESRLVRFVGPISKREDLLANSGWGDSILSRVHEQIRDFDAVHDGGAALVQDFAQAVFKMRGLHDAIAGDKAGLIKKRMALLDMSRSMLRALLIDAEGEDFERKPTPISGLPELMDRFANRLAAAAKMPVALLMGQSPAGLNATGAADTRFFYDQISAYQEREIKPQVEKIVRVLMAAKQGPTKGQEPERWCVEFHPLWQLDDVQKAEVRAKLATVDQIYLANGVVTAEEVAETRAGADGLKMDLTIDTEGREAFEAGEKLDPSETPRPPAEVDPKLAQAGVEKVQDTALNGAQVSSALEIVKSVARGELPRDAAVAMIVEFFNVDQARAERILGSVGKGFEPKKEEAPAQPFPAKESL